MPITDSLDAAFAGEKPEHRPPNCELSRYFKSYRKQLIQLAMARGCSREMAEDICQDVFMRMQKMMRAHTVTFARAYLSKITINLIHEYRRKDRKTLAWNEEMASRNGWSEITRKWQGMIAIEAFQCLGHGTLGHSEFRMFYEDELNSSTIASFLNTNAPSVRSRIQRFIARHKSDIENILDQDVYGVILSQTSEQVGSNSVCRVAAGEYPAQP